LDAVKTEVVLWEGLVQKLVVGPVNPVLEMGAGGHDLPPKAFAFPPRSAVSKDVWWQAIRSNSHSILEPFVLVGDSLRGVRNEPKLVSLLDGTKQTLLPHFVGKCAYLTIDTVNDSPVIDPQDLIEPLRLDRDDDGAEVGIEELGDWWCDRVVEKVIGGKSPEHLRWECCRLGRVPIQVRGLIVDGCEIGRIEDLEAKTAKRRKLGLCEDDVHAEPKDSLRLPAVGGRWGRARLLPHDLTAP
jgi:hypothetical protein